MGIPRIVKTNANDIDYYLRVSRNIIFLQYNKNDIYHAGNSVFRSFIRIFELGFASLVKRDGTEKNYIFFSM